MRLIPLREDSGALAMGIDEAILQARARDEVEDTCRLFVFNPSCVTLGYFQSYAQEIFDESRKKQGIDATRRITGGGAVFHDVQGEITYSVVMKQDNVPKNIQESYKVMCDPVIQALKELGLEGQFVPINDIVVGGKKISGSAQTRKKGVVLQHGTLMYNTNIDTLFSVLNVSKAKIADKMLASIKERVMTVSQALGTDVTRDQVEEAYVKGFEATFGALTESELTETELKEAQELAETKYGTDEWLNQR